MSDTPKLYQPYVREDNGPDMVEAYIPDYTKYVREQDYRCVERENANLRAEAERLREALLYAAETFRQINEGKHDPFSFDLRSNMRSAAGHALEKTRATLAATRKEEGNG